MTEPGTQRAEALIHGRALALTNLERVMFPSGFTKRDVIGYYRAIAPVMATHVLGRPMTMRRFPYGVTGSTWFQTRCRGRPPWVPVEPIGVKHGATHEYCLLNEPAAIVWAANMNTLELHPFWWRAGARDDPLAMVLDLDPGPPAGLPDACRLGLHLRARLEALGLTATPKTSGVRGLHVVVPLAPGHTWARVKAMARDLAAQAASDLPDLVVQTSARAARSGRVFVDWSQNDPGKSTVAPYSLRAAFAPGVSTPVAWDEVGHAAATGSDLHLRFSPDVVLARVREHGDLFAMAQRRDQHLPEPSAGR